MSNHPRYGSKHGPRYNPNDYQQNDADTDYGSVSSQRGSNFNENDRNQHPRFTQREIGYGEDIRGAGFNSQRSPYERYERDEYLQARGGLPGFNSSARSGSGYIYNGQNNNPAGVDHTGRGPKGWKRSDERIREDVSETLERHAGIDASEIEVAVKDGIVTLTGSVDHRRSKRLVEDAIDHVSGIKDIRNELNVNQSLFNQAREILTGENAPSGQPSTQKSKH